MKILLVGTGFMEIPPTGAGAVEQTIDSLASNLSNLGVDVTVLDIENKHRKKTNYNVKEIKAPFKDDKSALKHIIRGISFMLKVPGAIDGIYDIAHFGNQFSGFLGIRAAKRHNIRTVFHLHNAVWMNPDCCKNRRTKLKFWMEINCLKKSDFVISVGDALGQNIVKYLNIPEEKVVVIPNGVDTQIFKKISDEEKKTNDPIKILQVGRISHYKNQVATINVIPLTDESKTSFLFVGRIDDKDYYDRILKQKPKNSEFLGEVGFEELLSLYSTADIFVLPSKHEGMPLVLLEAMSFGLPTIVSDIPALTGVANEDTSIIVDPENEEEFSDAINLLVEDETLRKKLGENARRLVEQKYGWEGIAKKTKELYEMILNGGV